jgi:predicted nucleotidyltransferase
MSNLSIVALLFVGVMGIGTGLMLGSIFRDARFQTGFRVLLNSLIRVTDKKWARAFDPEIDIARIKRDQIFIAFPADQKAARVDAKARDAVIELKQNLMHKFGRQIEAVYLFGSRARGDNQPDSDVDVAIFLAEGCLQSMLRHEILFQSAELLLKYGLFLQPRIFAQNVPENSSENLLMQRVLSYGIPV